MTSSFTCFSIYHLTLDVNLQTLATILRCWPATAYIGSVTAELCSDKATLTGKEGESI